MSRKKQTPAADVSQPSVLRFVIAGMLLAVGLIAFYLFLRLYLGTAATEAENTALKKDLANVQAQLAELQAKKMYEDQQTKVQQSQLEQMSARTKAIAKTISELETQMAAWKALSQGLDARGIGPRIASNPETLRQCEAILTHPRPDDHLPAVLRTRLGALANVIDQAEKLKNPLFSFNDNFRQEISAVESEAGHALKLFAQHIAELEAVCKAAEAFSPGALSLDQAIKKLEQERASEQARATAEQVEKVREEYEKKLTETRRQYEEKLLQAKLDQERAQRESKLAQVQDETRRMQEAEENRRRMEAEQAAKRKQEQEARRARDDLERRYEADLADIKTHLAPLLASAYTQPRAGRVAETTTTKGPMSLARIRACGALAQDEQGLYKLHLTVFLDPERNKLGWPEFQDKEFFIKAQRFLIDYGELMVEKGLLAP